MWQPHVENKKLSCHRETARCCVSLNILLSYSGTIRKLEYGFLFAFHITMALSCILSEIKRYRLLVENRYIFIPSCIQRSRYGVPVGILPNLLVWKKLECVATRWWKNFEDKFSRFDRIPACDRQTDRPTDRQTDILRQHSQRYA